MHNFDGQLPSHAKRGKRRRSWRPFPRFTFTPTGSRLN